MNIYEDFSKFIVKLPAPRFQKMEYGVTLQEMGIKFEPLMPVCVYQPFRIKTLKS